MQACGVRNDGFLVGQAIAKAGLQAFLKPGSRLRKPVMHPRALPSCLDDAGGTKHPQMPGNLEVRRPKRIGQRAHADFTMARQQYHQPQAGRTVQWSGLSGGEQEHVAVVAEIDAAEGVVAAGPPIHEGCLHALRSGVVEPAELIGFG